MGTSGKHISTALFKHRWEREQNKMATKKLKERKYELADQLKQHFQDYTKLFLVDVDNVGSNQIHQIRIALRGKAIIYCGKNTQMRRVVRQLEVEQGMTQLEKVRLSLSSSTWPLSSPTRTCLRSETSSSRTKWLHLPGLV